MHYYMAYHNGERMGSVKVERLEVLTNKPVNREVLGAKVWVIVGSGQSKKTFGIGAWFIADHLVSDHGKVFKHRVSGQRGQLFDPLIPLDHEAWFDKFRKEHQYFSLGFRQIRNNEYIQAFNRLLDPHLVSES